MNYILLIKKNTKYEQAKKQTKKKTNKRQKTKTKKERNNVK